MNYTLTIERKPTYLHAIVTGTNSRDNVANYLQEVLRECTNQKCFRVLIEERLEGPRLGVLDVFEIASRGSKSALGKLRAIAYVDVHAEGGRMEFAETVAMNRAMPIRIFATVADAEEWILTDANSTD